MTGRSMYCVSDNARRSTSIFVLNTIVMDIKHLCWTLVVGAAIVSACASSGGKSASRVAPNNQNILLEVQTALDISKARIAYVRNGSSVPVVVTEVSILDCQNLKQYCGINTTAVRVEPGQRQEIIRIEPQDISKGFNYRLQWRWRGASAAATRPAPGDTVAMRRAAMMELVEQFRAEEAKYGDKILYPNVLAAIGDNFASMRADPDTVVVAVGSRLYIYEQLRVLGVDKTGKVIGRVRTSMQWSVARSPAFRFLSPDTLHAEAAGTTTVTMRLNQFGLLDTLRASTMPPVTFTIIAK
ncbi:MAG: hypothetical protein ABJB74_23165 [Gemmatimonas sp.]